MRYINLSDITEAHLTGLWYVEDRIVTKNEINLFKSSKKLELTSEGFYKSTNGETLIGNWFIQKENTLINNPLIQFYRDEQSIGEAMVTRLFWEVENNLFIHRLTIYFTTGLELILIKRVG
jgi:hypothetical protein